MSFSQRLMTCFTRTHTAVSVTSAPNAGKQVDGAAVAGGLIFGVIIVLSVFALIVFVIILLRKRKKTFNVTNYAHFE